MLLIGYEWFKLSTGGALPFAMPERSEPASQHQMQAFFDNLVRELDKVEFLRPREKRETMLVNLRNIFTRMDPTKQDMHTLHGVVMAIAEGRKGPAKGGVLDGEQATRLRALLAEHGQGPAVPGDSSTVRGLARLLRRNPTDAERILWQALTRDRRFAGSSARLRWGVTSRISSPSSIGWRSSWSTPMSLRRSSPTAPAARRGWKRATTA